MIKNGKMQELETVVLTEDLPEYGLKRGEKGVVVETFDQPENEDSSNLSLSQFKLTNINWRRSHNPIFSTSTNASRLQAAAVDNRAAHQVKSRLLHDSSRIKESSSYVTRRHRRFAERRQINSVQRAHRNARRRERKLPLQHQRHKRWRGQRPRRAIGTSSQNRQDEQDRLRHRRIRGYCGTGQRRQPGRRPGQPVPAPHP